MHSQYRYTVTADSYLYIHATFPASCAANKSSEFVKHVQGKNQKILSELMICRAILHFEQKQTVFIYGVIFNKDYKHMSRPCIVFNGKVVTIAIKSIIINFPSRLLFQFCFAHILIFFSQMISDFT